MKREFAFLLLFVLFLTIRAKDSSPSFKIDKNNSQFLLDGDPFQFLSGEIHYFRIPHQKWDDRLKRVRALGFNTITVPVPWNLHQYDDASTPEFTGNLDLFKFIKTAYKNGLYAIVKIGPYISAEWDNGGLPWWLARFSKITKYRSSDPVYMNLVTEWFQHLLPKMLPLTRKNDGPIIMVQIEHFYGTLGICDQAYLLALANMAREHLGNDVVLSTADQPAYQYMCCGVLPNVLPTIEISPNANAEQIEYWFNLQKSFMTGAPAVASHFVINPYKLWGKNVSDPYPTDLIVQTAKTAYGLNASLSFHMTHGGTNFGFWNGALDPYPVTTSYDSFAPIGEAGDVNELFIALRFWINSIPGWQWPPTSIPSNLPRTAYPDVTLTYFDSISEFILGTNPECWHTPETPRTAESIRNGFGYVYYSTTIEDCGTLSISKFADNAYIFLNQDFVGALYKQFGSIHNNTIDVEGCLEGSNTLEIMVEITGRPHNYYPDMSRGIQGNVYMHNVTLEDWSSCQVPIETYQISKLKNFDKIKSYITNRSIVKKQATTTVNNPSVYLANWHIKTTPTDTFIDVRGWGKGTITINQYNIGRYWSSMGPQQTLFIPSEFLHKGLNLIMFYEFEGATTACTPVSCSAKFTNIPIFDY